MKFQNVFEAHQHLANIIGEFRDYEDTVNHWQRVTPGNYQTVNLTDLVEKTKGYYMDDTSWVCGWLRANGFVECGGFWVAGNANNVPTAFASVRRKHLDDFNVIVDGPAELAIKFVCEAAKYTRYSETLVSKTYIDVVGYDRDGDFNLSERELGETRPVHPEYHPYIDGGFMNLMSAFMLSPEAVMMLGGCPGAGKSTGIATAAAEMGLTILRVCSGEVIRDSRFVRQLFETHARLLRRHEAHKAMRRHACLNEVSPVFPLMTYLRWQIKNGRTEFDTSLANAFAGYEEYNEVESNAGYPVILLEDADYFVTERRNGNDAMQDLLNGTDGVGTNGKVKVIITTNIEQGLEADAALFRPGRGFNDGFFSFPKLTPAEAIAARKAAGLPDFETVPERDMALAEALRAPQPKLFLRSGKVAYAPC